MGQENTGRVLGSIGKVADALMIVLFGVPLVIGSAEERMATSLYETPPPTTYQSSEGTR